MREPGTPLRELLVQRAAAGTFNGDPDRYVAEALRLAAEGRTEAKTVELADGRMISLVNRPIRGGGWVATHFDVTKRLRAEKERDCAAGSARSGGGKPTSRFPRSASGSRAGSRPSARAPPP